MKRIFYLILPVLCFNIADAQTWEALGDGMNNTVQCVFMKDTLYAGGKFTNAGGQSINKISMWVNGNWKPLGQGVDNQVKTITQINGRIYAGGEFIYSKDSLLNCFAEWDGNTFRGYAGGFVKSGQHTVSTTVNAIIEYKNKIYAGGIFDYANFNTDYTKNIASWNGSKWEEAGGGVDGVTGVNCMLVYHDTLYVAGGFTNAGSIVAKYIAKWDGTNWYDVGGGMNSVVNSLTILNDTLYAGGIFTQAGGSNAAHIARLSGNTWLPVGAGVNGNVNVIVADNSSNTLYVGGVFTQAGGQPATNMARWKSSGWEAVGNPDGAVKSFACSNNQLFAGGDFSGIAGVNTAKIARMNTHVGIEPAAFTDVTVYPNPADNYLYIDVPVDKKFDQVCIYDMLGQVVLAKSFSPLTDVSHLKPGNYILVAGNSNSITRKKICISHE